MKSEPTEKNERKAAVSETADRKNGRSPGRPRQVVGKTHDGTGFRRIRRYGCGTGDSSGARYGRGVQEAGKKGHPLGTGDPVRKRTKAAGAAQGPR